MERAIRNVRRSDLYDADRWSVGLLASKFTGAGRGDVNTYRLFGDYEVTEAKSVGAQSIELDLGASSQSVIGLSSDYGFGSGGFAGLGASFPNGSSDDLYTASIGYRL